MKHLLICLVCLLPWAVQGQAYIIDTAFQSGNGASGTVFGMDRLPDGRVLLGGSFSDYNSQMSPGLVRIHPNGQRDLSLQVGFGLSGRAHAVKHLGDGRFYAAGLFSAYNGTSINNLARFMPGGQLDTSFQPGSGPNNEVLSMEIFPDGSVMLSGFFGQYQGQPVNQPIRVLPSGSLDTSFNPGGAGTSGLIDAIHRQADGRILLGGSFSTYNGQSANKIVRIHPNGSIDTSFRTGMGFAGNVRTLDVQADGKIVVGGTFVVYNGRTALRLIRLWPDGRVDSTFNTGTGVNATVRKVLARADGSIVVLGDFATYNGTTVNRVAVLSSTGQLLSGVNNCSGTNGSMQSAVELLDSSLLVGGGFTQAGGMTHRGVIRLVAAPAVGQASQPVLAVAGTSLCPGDPVTLSISSGQLNAAAQWQWFVGGCGSFPVGSGPSLLVQPLRTTTYYVRGEGNCIAPGPCASITVQVLDSLPPVPLRARLPDLQAYCSLTVDTIPAAMDQCAGRVLGITNDPRTYNRPGTYTIVWNYSDGAGNVSSQTQQVQVDSLDLAVTANNLRLQVGQSGAQYQWLDAQQQLAPIPGATAQSFTAPQSGAYAVEVVYAGCTDTSAVVAAFATGLAAEAAWGLRIYPNPATDRVVFNTAVPLTARLRDAQGRTLLVVPLAAGETAVQLPALAAGLYLWELQGSAGVAWRRQLVR